jgi:hypothetical protein
MKTFLGSVGAAALFATAAPAGATTVVDFNEFAHGGGEARYGSHVESGGLTFQLDIDSAQAYIVYGRNDGRNADPGGATLMSNLMSRTTRVTRTDSGLFDLVSIDMADFFNTGQLTWVRFDFTDASGAQSSEIRSLDTLKGLETLNFGKSNLKSFDFTYLVNRTPGSPGWGQFDNVAVNFATAGVPEPTSWALMILGFGGVGATLRRRRTAPATA